MRTRFHVTLTFPLAVMALLGIGCRSETRQPPAVVEFAADLKIPNQGLVDWVSYSNQVSIVSVLSEAEIEPPPEVRERQEGYIGRTVSVRVNETLWSAPGVEPVHGDVTLRVLGWHLKDGKKIPFRGQLEVGRQYVMPLAVIEGKLADASITRPVPLESGTITSADLSAEPWSSGLAGLSSSELRSRLASTEPDPIAARYSHLPADERAQAVHRERGTNGLNP